MQEQELFQTYELKGWQFSPRLYKIIGASAIINLVWFVLLAQANFLTGKTCDSPIASGVCSVLDTLYVGGMILDTDSEYVDKPYEPTEIGDADEITYINVGDYKPLEYPVGYFALANPDQQLDAMGNPIITSSEIPGISSNPTDLMNVNPTLPQPNGSVLDEPLPTNPLGTVNNSTTGKVKRDKKNTLSNDSPKTLPGDNKADDQIESDKVVEVEINKKPLQDFTDGVLVQWEAKEVDLNQQFIVVMDGVLTKDGELDESKSKWLVNEEKGDPKMIEIAKEAVESVGKSHWLAYLRNFGIEKIKITLKQDNDNLIAIIESEQKIPERAYTLSTQVNNAMSWAKIGIKGEDEKTLLSSAKATHNGKIFILNFELPKPKAQEMINRKLQDAQARKSQQKNDG